MNKERSTFFGVHNFLNFFVCFRVCLHYARVPFSIITEIYDRIFFWAGEVNILIVREIYGSEINWLGSRWALFLFKFLFGRGILGGIFGTKKWCKPTFHFPIKSKNLRNPLKIKKLFLDYNNILFKYISLWQ